MKTGKYYVANSVISGNIRNDLHTTYRVLATLNKEADDKGYNKIISVEKDVELTRLLKKVNNTILIDECLLNENRSISASLDEVKQIADKIADAIDNGEIHKEQERNLPGRSK